MASLSIMRRRHAWIAGVICGATGHGVCALKVPKLREIYERGVQFGRANAETPGVKTIVAAHKRPPAPKMAPRQQNNRFRSRSVRGSSSPSRFDRPNPNRRSSF